MEKGRDDSLKDDEGEEKRRTKPPKSKRSILKNDDAGDTADDTADDNSNANGPGEKENDPSENGEKEDSKRSWIKRLRRSKSGDDGEDNEDNDDDKSKNNRDDSAASVSEADAQSTAQQSIITKTSQANRNTKTIEDCETEYHEAIREHDWDYLESLLKEYDPTVYKKPKKEPTIAGKKQLKFLKYMPDLSRFKKEKEEPEIPISPLLALDKDGRTPLHLCCTQPTPTKLLLRVMNSARDAAAVKDKKGSIPLHLAIRNRRKVSEIERLVRGYYQGSWTGDNQNETPLTMAIDVVLQKQQEENIKPTKTYWGFPESPEDVKWQEDQKKLWQLPAFLVENRFSRRKKLLTVEHNQILVALNKCAPPDVISKMMATGKKHVLKDDVAGKVLFLLISRQYPMDVFQWLLDAISIDYIKEQQDATGCGVVAAHFRIGCIKHRDQNKRERDSFAITMKRIADAKNNGEDFVPTPQYTEWWEKLRLFINLWSTHSLQEGEGEGDIGGDQISCEDELLLHNALMNSDAPPLLIQLLAILYPKSTEMNYPKSSALPIHFACRQWQFREYPPRRGEKKVKLDQISSELLKKDPTQTRKRHRKRLPLHHAIAISKTWDFIKPLVTYDLKSLLVRDPTTSLRPFQMAASKIQGAFDIEKITRRGYTPIVWSKMTDDEQDRQMRKLLYNYDLKQLDLIYELLRHSPGAITMRVVSSNEKSLSTNKNSQSAAQLMAHHNLVTATETKLARSLFGLGNVEGHFIGWCYESGSDGVWKPHRTNFPVVKEAIIDGFVPMGMDKWWRKLKFWLWQDCPWDNIPRRADYLLHCALCNPKVSPWIVELMLECFPRSATMPLPDSDGCYPLHIACVTDTYMPLPFEFANKRNVIEMVSKAFNESILLKWNGRLPLHYAILGSKQWAEMNFMAEDEPVSVAIPDSKNDFFPFQLMALYKSYSKAEMRRFQNIAMVTFGKNLWANASLDEKVEQLEEVLLKHETKTVGCIFELLRRNPMLLHVGTVESKNRSYHRGDVEGSANQPADELSIHQYLHLLRSNPSSAGLDIFLE